MKVGDVEVSHKMLGEDGLGYLMMVGYAALGAALGPFIAAGINAGAATAVAGAGANAGDGLYVLLLESKEG